MESARKKWINAEKKESIDVKRWKLKKDIQTLEAKKYCTDECDDWTLIVFNDYVCWYNDLLYLFLLFNYYLYIIKISELR